MGTSCSSASLSLTISAGCGRLSTLEGRACAALLALQNAVLGDHVLLAGGVEVVQSLLGDNTLGCFHLRDIVDALAVIAL